MADGGEIREMVALQNIVNGSKRLHAELRNTVPRRPRSHWYSIKLHWIARARDFRDAWRLICGKGIE